MPVAWSHLPHAVWPAGRWPWQASQRLCAPWRADGVCVQSTTQLVRDTVLAASPLQQPADAHREGVTVTHLCVFSVGSLSSSHLLPAFLPGLAWNQGQPPCMGSTLQGEMAGNCTDAPQQTVACSKLYSAGRGRGALSKCGTDGQASLEGHTSAGSWGRTKSQRLGFWSTLPHR